MTEIPVSLKNGREIQAIPTSSQEFELRHRWLPGAPSWTYGVIMALAAGGILFFFGWPSSRDMLTFELGILALVAYPLAALCYNSTTLTVTPEKLAWRYGPLPWKPAGSMAREEMAGFTYGKIQRTVSSEEFAQQQRSGYHPPPRYAVTLRLRKRSRERRVFDLVGDLASAEAAARFLSGVLGNLPVEQCDQRNRSELPGWGYTVILLGVLAFVGLLLFSLFQAEP